MLHRGKFTSERWYFFQEIFRSKDLKAWEAAPGMGSSSAIGTPLLLPNGTADRAVAPGARFGEPADGTGPSNAYVTQERWAFLSKLASFFGRSPDVNVSDMDLCEWRNQTLMYFNWGEQH